jgi:hypothetical protein
LAFLKPIATGWASGPDGESRHSLVPGAKTSLMTYTLAAGQVGARDVLAHVLGHKEIRGNKIYNSSSGDIV